MANNLQFTTPVSVPNLQKCKLGTVFVDEDGATTGGTPIILIQVITLGGGGVKQFENPWILRVTNGSVDALVADTNATVISLVLRSVTLGGAGVVAAYTTALAGYRSAGADKRGNLMTALQGITGVIQNPSSEVGVLSGTTVAILPAGVVS